jgi:hypothetical protein
MYRISRPIRRIMIFSLGILEKNKRWWMYFNFSNLLEENRIVTYLVTSKQAVHKQWCQISWFGSKFHYLTIKMLYNRCTGIYKFGNNTYPRRIRRRSNLDNIFRWKKKVCLMGREIRYLDLRDTGTLSDVCIMDFSQGCHIIWSTVLLLLFLFLSTVIISVMLLLLRNEFNLFDPVDTTGVYYCRIKERKFMSYW